MFCSIASKTIARSFLALASANNCVTAARPIPARRASGTMAMPANREVQPRRAMSAAPTAAPSRTNIRLAAKSTLSTRAVCKRTPTLNLIDTK
jgi:hypothetical protein